jgi:NodT family efflux transporter outer membrane factor (OMF) lipoprotein
MKAAPRTAALAAALAATLACAACIGPQRDEPELTQEPPPAWSAAAVDADPGGAEGDVPELDAWWTALGEPGLDAFVREALRNNHDLAAAAARVDQAAALARIAGAGRQPQVSAGADASRVQNVFTNLPVPGGDEPLSSTATTWGVSLDVTWEIDLWGRIGAAARAARLDLEAAADDRDAARRSLAAQTIKGWFAWREALLQLELSARAIESRERTLEVVERRFLSGRGSAFEVRSAQADLAGERAVGALAAEAVERRARALEVLAGRHPAGDPGARADERVGPQTSGGGGANDDLVLEGDALPEIDAVPAAGVPSELLLRRPDLRAVERRMRAADERLYEARAELYPRLSLGASAGRTSSRAEDLGDPDFDVWSIAAGLTQPIFQGGRLRAGVDLDRARVREALEVYAQAVLRAFEEVETGLAVDGLLARQELARDAAASNATEAFTLARDRYASGREDVTALLGAQRRAIDAQRALLEIRRRRIEQRADLVLALGGDIARDESLTAEARAREDEDDQERGR